MIPRNARSAYPSGADVSAKGTAGSTQVTQAAAGQVRQHGDPMLAATKATPIAPMTVDEAHHTSAEGKPRAMAALGHKAAGEAAAAAHEHTQPPKVVTAYAGQHTSTPGDSYSTSQYSQEQGLSHGRQAEQVGREAGEQANQATSKAKDMTRDVATHAADTASQGVEQVREAAASGAQTTKEFAAAGAEQARQGLVSAQQTSKEYAAAGADKAKQAAATAQQTAVQAAEQTHEGAKTVTQYLYGAVQKMKEVVGSTAASVQEQATPMLNQAGEYAGSALEQAREHTKELPQAAGQKLADLAAQSQQAAQEKMEEISKTREQWYQEYQQGQNEMQIPGVNIPAETGERAIITTGEQQLPQQDTRTTADVRHALAEERRGQGQGQERMMTREDWERESRLMTREQFLAQMNRQAQGGQPQSGQFQSNQTQASKQVQFQGKSQTSSQPRSLQSSGAVMKPIDFQAVQSLLLWRKPAKSGSVLLAATFAYIFLHLSSWNPIAVLSRLSLMFLVFSVIWNNLVRWLNRPQLVIGQNLCAGISDRTLQNLSRRVAAITNSALLFAHRVLDGRDPLSIAKAFGSLYLLAKIAPYFSAAGLLYTITLLAFTLPKLYEQHHEDIQAVAHRATERATELIEAGAEKLPRASDIQARLQGAAQSATAHAQGAAQTTSARVQEAAHSASAKVQGVAQQAGSYVQGTAQQAGSYAQGSAQQTRDTAQHTMDTYIAPTTGHGGQQAGHDDNIHSVGHSISEARPSEAHTPSVGTQRATASGDQQFMGDKRAEQVRMASAGTPVTEAYEIIHGKDVAGANDGQMQALHHVHREE